MLENSMRLNRDQIATIRQVLQDIAGEDARAIVFGSRLRDDAKGGDLDLLVESDFGLGLLQRARIKLALETQLGLPVDVIALQRGKEPAPFQRIAMESGVPL
jgi:predicted nucleotidyltransferase